MFILSYYEPIFNAVWGVFSFSLDLLMGFKYEGMSRNLSIDVNNKID